MQLPPEAPSEPKDSRAPLCVVDLGTNSFHALIVDPRDDGSFDVIDKLKLPVALGEAGLGERVLTNDAVARATRALTQIATLAQRRGAKKTLAFATSAIREADNGPEFVKHIRDTLGLNIEPIDGDREAHLIYLGVRRTIEIVEPTLIVDIGGGSTEFIVASKAGPLFECSLKLGAARVTERFIKQDPLGEKERTEIDEHYARTLTDVLDACATHRVKEMVGSSGTMEALATLSMGSRSGEPFQFSLSAAEVLETTEMLIASTDKERSKLSDLDERRRDQIVAGASLVDFLIRNASLKTLRVSPAALREGMVDEFVDPDAKVVSEDVLVRMATELCIRHRVDLEHAQEVTDLALELFDQLKKVHKLGDKERRLLRLAGLVHDVGHAVSGRAHHKHTAYIVEQTNWPGVEPRDVSMIAQISRYHRRALPKKKHGDFAALKKKDRRRVRKLAALLRLSDKLDRSHIGNTESVRLGIKRRAVHLTISTKLEPDLELSSARSVRAAFADAFGRELSVHAAWKSDDS